MSAPGARPRSERELLAETVREAHGVVKDLRAATREARDLLDRLVAETVMDRIEAETVKGLGEMGDAIRRAMDASVAKVGREFDRLANLYLKGPTKSGVPLHELAARARARRAVW